MRHLLLNNNSNISRTVISLSRKAKAAVLSQQRQQQPQHRCCFRRYIHIENRIKELGITLPTAAGPRANYDVISYDEEARVMYVSGHLPFTPEDGTLMTGKITDGAGDDGKDIDYGYKAARYAALNIVSTVQDRLAKLGTGSNKGDTTKSAGYDLDQIEKIQKVFGIVQSSDEFKHQHLVMDGASDVLMEIFGNKVGYHARSAIGTNTLPLDITVEIEAVIKLKPMLRYTVGQTVECKTGPQEWSVGVITQLNYKEPEWEHSAPYQIRIDGTDNDVGVGQSRYIFAPEDSENVIRDVQQK